MLFTIDTLRPYQKDIIDAYKSKYMRGKSICLQAPTGTGKTAVLAGIASLIIKREKCVWIVVPRNHLEWNMSEHLTQWQISHGVFNSKQNPSLVYNVHVVSKDTLIRRMNADKMQNIKHPDFILIDESHIALSQQLQLRQYFTNTDFIGLTATPEADSPMSEMWDDLVLSPSIKWFMDRGYLAKVRYFQPPFLDVSTLRNSTGKDYTEKEIEILFGKQKKIYGDVIATYRKYCHKLPAICSTGSVKLAYETANEFMLSGYTAQAIDGGMSKKQLKYYLSEFKAGRIDILCNCMIATYGLDLPNCCVGLDLAPTKSTALYLQKFGRVIRPLDGQAFKFWFDFVNNSDIHNIGGLYYHEVDAIEWNFYGKKKKRTLCDTCKNYFENHCPKIARSEITSDIIKDVRKMPVYRCKDYLYDESGNIKKCPFCFVRLEGNRCPICGHTECRTGATKDAVQIDCELVERQALAVPISQLPAEEKALYNDRINAIKSRHLSGDEKALADMIVIQRSRGYSDLWVYHQLNPSGKYAVNVSLLHAMAKAMGHKAGKVWFWKKVLKKSEEL